MVTAARLSAESLAALGTPPRSPRSKLDDDGTSDAEQTPDVDDTELICPVCEDEAPGDEARRRHPGDDPGNA